MAEDLEYIDLIDKHLNGELSGQEQLRFDQLLETDPEFKKELAVYRQLYSDIEEHEDAALKNRMDDYYQDYLKEESGTGGRQRFLYWATGIAACLAIGFFVLREPSEPPSIIGETPGKEIKDSADVVAPPKEPTQNFTQEEGKQEVKDPDRIPNDRPRAPVMALGGLQVIPPDQIMEVQYPLELQYKFDGKTVRIIGDPRLAPLQLIILKNKGDYYLNIRGTTYPIEKTDRQKSLVANGQNLSAGEDLEEKLSIKVENILATSSQTDSVDARITGSASSQPSYVFEQKEGKKVLTLDANWSVNEVKIIHLTGEKQQWFAQYRSNLYLLDEDATSATLLSPLNILSDNTTRLFRERAPFQVQVKEAR